MKTLSDRMLIETLITERDQWRRKAETQRDDIIRRVVRAIETAHVDSRSDRDVRAQIIDIVCLALDDE